MKPLLHKVTLKGAKSPKDYFYIRYYPQATGEGKFSQNLINIISVISIAPPQVAGNKLKLHLMEWYLHQQAHCHLHCIKVELLHKALIIVVAFPEP